MSLPRITVIVPAHDRREYILHALKSVLNQSLDRSFYEIVVVKNFYDKDIDKFIEEHNIRSYYTQREELGAKLRIGIEESKGDIVCFLEDDDLFHPDKLRKVRDSFNEYSKRGLGLYFHDSIMIDEKGNIVKSMERLKYIKGQTIYINKYDSITYSYLIKIKPFANSSTCISKSMVHTHILDRLNPATDEFFLIEALYHNKGILLDKEPLNYYRIHSLNESIFSGQNWRDIVKRSCEFQIKAINDIKAILSHIRDSPDLFEIYQYVLIDRLFLRNITCGLSKLETLSMTFKLLGSPVHFRKHKVEFLIGAMLQLISVNLAQRTYAIAHILNHRII